jgi:hypothetical protein
MTALSITLALVAVVAAALAAVAVIAWRRALAASVRRDDAAESSLAELRERLAVLERAAVRPEHSYRASSAQEYVITRLGDAAAQDDERTPAQVSVKAPAFADAVLRESVVQTASLVHGLRRALAPETRNRIRFEMKRELKRTRKARKVELKQALREFRARQRDGAGAGDTRPVDVHVPDEGVA